MGKRKRKLTAQQRAHKKRRRREFMAIFVGGKQKRVKRPPTIEGLSEDELIRANADPLWYHQNEMWEEIGTDEISEGGTWAEREEEFIRLNADPIWYQNETCAQIGKPRHPSIRALRALLGTVAPRYERCALYSGPSH